MRVVGIIALIGVVLLATTTAPSAATIQEIFEKNVAFKPGGLLTLDNLNGAVEIRSWDKAEVSIRARIKIGERDRKEAEKLYDEVTIAVEASSAGLEIYTDAPRNLGRGRNISVHYELTVPEEIDMDIRTVNGKVYARDITGTLILKTTNGSVEASGAGP
jgi:DUF4097 and DUF4098 domain-containing protein YvlB